VTKKRGKTPSTRLDRQIAAALGKKGSKLWPVPTKPRRAHAILKPGSAAPAATAPSPPRESHCRFCHQELYWEPDGHFECGGEGEGACTFWNVIGDYDRAGRPADIEGWLDQWIQEAVGMDWDAMGWSRAKHAKAIRDYFRIPLPSSQHAHAVKTETESWTAEEWARLSLAAMNEAGLARRVSPTTAARWEKLAKASRATLTDNDWFWLARAANHQARQARREGDETAAARWEELAEKAEAAA
jgi:hypothetical protein